MNRTKPISGKLLELQKEIQGYADEYGLDYFPQVFEICDYDTINILAAQGGFPNAILIGCLECNTINFLKGTVMGFKKFMKW
jgi:stage V sporulation protein R